MELCEIGVQHRSSSTNCKYNNLPVFASIPLFISVENQERLSKDFLYAVSLA